MFLKKCCVPAAIAVYFVLIALFVYHQNYYEFDENIFHRYLKVCHNKIEGTVNERFDRSDLNSWELFCCVWHGWILVIGSAISALLLIVTVSGFGFGSSRNEKLIALFVFGDLLLICGPAIYNFTDMRIFSLVVLDTGRVSCVLALTILCFDARFLAGQETQSEVNRMNKFDKIFSAVFLILSILFIRIVHTLEDDEWKKLLFFGYSTLLCLILVADVFAVALAMKKAQGESRVEARSDAKTWKNQKERLVKYVQLLAITMINLCIGTTNFWIFKDYTSNVVSDLVNFFSAFIIFTIFVLDQNSRFLFKQPEKLEQIATEIPITPQ